MLMPESQTSKEPSRGGLALSKVCRWYHGVLWREVALTAGLYIVR